MRSVIIHLCIAFIFQLHTVSLPSWLHYLWSLERWAAMENRANTCICTDMLTSEYNGWLLFVFYLNRSNHSVSLNNWNKSKIRKNVKEKLGSQTSNKHLHWQLGSFTRGSSSLCAGRISGAPCSVKVLRWRKKPSARTVTCVHMYKSCHQKCGTNTDSNNSQILSIPAILGRGSQGKSWMDCSEGSGRFRRICGMRCSEAP